MQTPVVLAVALLLGAFVCSINAQTVQQAWMYEVFTDENCSIQANQLSTNVLNVGWNSECLISDSIGQNFESLQLPGNETYSQHNFACNATTNTTTNVSTCFDCKVEVFAENGYCTHSTLLRSYAFVSRLQRWNATVYKYKAGNDGQLGLYGQNCSIIAQSDQPDKITVPFGVCQQLPNGKYEIYGKNFDSTSNRWGYGVATGCEDPLCSVRCQSGSFYFADTQCLTTTLYGTIAFQNFNAPTTTGATTTNPTTGPTTTTGNTSDAARGVAFSVLLVTLFSALAML